MDDEWNSFCLDHPLRNKTINKTTFRSSSAMKQPREFLLTGTASSRLDQQFDCVLFSLFFAFFFCLFYLLLTFLLLNVEDVGLFWFGQLGRFFAFDVLIFLLHQFSFPGCCMFFFCYFLFIYFYRFRCYWHLNGFSYLQSRRCWDNPNANSSEEKKWF